MELRAVSGGAQFSTFINTEKESGSVDPNIRIRVYNGCGGTYLLIPAEIDLMSSAEWKAHRSILMNWDGTVTIETIGGYSTAYFIVENSNGSKGDNK